jgi:threonine synthase
MGIYVEQTAAAVIAGAVKYCKENSIAENMVKVAPLTGTGLKK